MELSQISQLVINENKHDMLQPIDEEFYIKATEYLKTLRQKSLNEKKPKSRMLIDGELLAVNNSLKSFYEKRQLKIVDMAVATNAGYEINTKNMTSMERKTFDKLIIVLADAKEKFIELTGVEAEEE